MPNKKKKVKEKGTVLIVDGDVIAFRAAAASTKNELKITHKASGKSKMWKNITTYKKLLKLKGIPFVAEDYVIETVTVAAPAKIPCKVMDIQLSKMQSHVFADKLVMFVSGDNNFRDTLPLPTQYKSNRVDSIRPPALNECKDHLVKEYKGTRSHGMETDDMVIVAARHYQKLGYDVVIATNDKDAFAYAGISIYVYTDEDSEPIHIESLGELHITDNNKVKGTGFMWLCFQLINGDDTDNFKPCELLGIKFGEKSAYKLLVNCKTEQECFDVVCKQYKTWYPDVVMYDDYAGESHAVKWKELLQLYFYCAKMKETMDDDLSVDTYIESKGLVWNET